MSVAAPAGPGWERGLPPTAKLYPPRRGLRDVRGIIHLHSAFSHDACDGNPLPQGKPAEPCHHELADGLCATHQDFVMLTDHDTSFSDHDWEEEFGAVTGAQEPVMSPGGAHIASWVKCPDGSRFLLQLGSENEVMPIGLESHVSDDVAMRHALMKGSDATSVAAFRAHGALVAFAHTEVHGPEQQRAVKPDVTEVYNIHANLDPKIRVDMHLDPTAPLGRLGPFLRADDPGLVSDMAFLAIAEDLPAETDTYDTMLMEGVRLFGSAGSDAHENTLPAPMADGERGDSYRRVMRWFGNHLLVDEITPAKIKDAIKAGRGYVLFEAFGPARGFDAHVESADGSVLELGAEVPLAGSPTIVVVPPHIEVAEGVQAPAVHTRLLLIDRPGGTEVASSDGETTIRFAVKKAGPYRVVVRTRPNHLLPYLGANTQLLREFTWILANPFYVK